MKKMMRRLCGLLRVAALTTLVVQDSEAVDLRIAPDLSGGMRFNWNTLPDVDYDLQYTSLVDAFSLWTPVSGPITASGTNLSYVTPFPEGDRGFYRVLTYNGVPLPFVTIKSPTNGQTVSGLITVFLSAKDDSRITAVSLYVDDNPVGEITEGKLELSLNTAHYSNGVHTLSARVQDNVGIGYLGGDPDEVTMVNEAFSTPVTLTFDNPVRWPDAETLFETDVPIRVETDIFPADWTVFIRNESGTTVRTFSGTTLLNLITTNWDGLDQNGQPLPSDAAYEVEVAVTSSLSQLLQGGNLLVSPNQDYSFKDVFKNEFGVEEYRFENTVKTEPSWTLAEFIETKFNPKTGEYEIIKEPKYELLGKESSFTVTQRVSVAEFNLGSGSQLMMAAAGASGSVKAFVWRETPWSSGEIILARQQYTASIVGVAFNTVLANNLNQLATRIEDVNGNIGNNRGVYGSNPEVMAADVDYDFLLNDLTQQNVRALYYHGHANGGAIGFSETTPDHGLTWSAISAALTNFYLLPITNRIPAKYRFGKPFNFVFIDGCDSANGRLPEVFGIPKAVPASQYVKTKKRAFMGWASTTKDSIANNDFQQWTQKFWEIWLGNNGNHKLKDAIVAADLQYPSIPSSAPLKVYGTQELKWAD